MEPIYDRHGKAVAFRHRDYIYNPQGKAIALIRLRNVFTFKGEHRGRFEDGYYRDPQSRAVGFEKGATGGPTQPIPERNVINPPGWDLPHPPDIKDVPKAPPFRANAWSDLTWAEFLRGKSAKASSTTSR
jgi:hypothetical protein